MPLQPWSCGSTALEMTVVWTVLQEGPIPPVPRRSEACVCQSASSLPLQAHRRATQQLAVQTGGRCPHRDHPDCTLRSGFKLLLKPKNTRDGSV